MIEIKEPVDGECTVVEADALLEMTKWEWKLLMVLPERVQTNKEHTARGVWKDIVDERGSKDRKYVYPEPEFGDGHRYLLVRRPDVALKEAIDQRYKAHQDVSNALDCASKASEEMEKLKSTLEKSEKETKSVKDAHERVRDAYQQELSSRRKMEEHLAKVRQAIGDIEFKRLSGE